MRDPGNDGNAVEWLNKISADNLFLFTSDVSAMHVQQSWIRLENDMLFILSELIFIYENFFNHRRRFFGESTVTASHKPYLVKSSC